MKKNIDTFAVALMLFPIEVLGGLEEALRELFQKLPERDDGPELDEDDFVAAGVKLYFDHAKPLIEQMVDGELPEVTEDDLPKPTTTPPPTTTPGPPDNVVKIMNTGAKMSWNSYYYDKFVFPKLGPEYTSEPFDIVYSDGNILHVSNPEHMVMTPDNMKYQPGGRYSGNNPDIPTMEVYARRDTHPEWVKAVFRHPV